MNKIKFERFDQLAGWLCFAIAAWTYLDTVEPSVSFWDCPEYVTCAAKGEVGHPPGNTFFLLAGRFFANFAAGDMTQVAIWINRMSALFSAGTILFLFWSITALTFKLMIKRKEEPTLGQTILILGCGLVGALAYTWSDTFWFSAVEAEVYAFSSFMTALTFWLILKWEQRAVQPSADKYLILISYIVGLSIGVHLLNLLCLPAIVLIYYFHHKRQATVWGVTSTLCLSVVLIAVILYGIIPGIIWLAKGSELWMVNSLGLPYHSGTLACYMGIVGLLIAMYICICRGHLFRASNTRLAANIVFSLLMILVGYSTFAQILIRSSAGLPMNENTPDNIFSLSRYLNREQYGESPLLFGQTFTSSAIKDKYDGNGPELYAKVIKESEDEPDRYYVYDKATKYEYDYTTFFPRMYSTQPEHVEGYKQWSGYKGQKVRVKNAYGNQHTITVPTFGENLTYFFQYQLGHMYWRYFLWNFCGRQNDLKSYGEADRGNWITGFDSIDQWLIGSSEEMPECITHNKGHNVYYMLPLLLGLLGMGWQWKKGVQGRQQWLVVSMLFLMTGIAIVVYLNQTPYQPRERDYAYAGSFYAFSIWIGMGVAGLHSLLERVLKQKRPISTAIGSAVLGLIVPIQMVGQTWDDHDRSDRYLARDFGRNYLASLDQDGIIFTNGDNDTFPLWYAIETEGFRTDTRACNLAYLQTDWYIDQMKSPAYDSKPLPIPFSRKEYAGTNLYFMPVDSATKKIVLDEDAIRQSDAFTIQESDTIPEAMEISLGDKRYLLRNDVVKLDMIKTIANEGWKRPIYFACSVGPSEYRELMPYLRTVGLAYQVVPIETGGPESVDIERTYDCVMNRFHWGNANLHGIYLDETCLNMCATHRMVFARLIDALLESGDKERTLKVAERCLEVLPSFNVPHDASSLSIVHCLYVCGKIAEADAICKEMLVQTDQYLHWVSSLNKRQRISCSNSVRRSLYIMHSILLELSEQQSNNLINSYSSKFNFYYEQFKKQA